MRKIRIHMLVMLTVFVLAVPAALAAEEPPPPPPEGERNRPVPPFAIDACKGKTDGDACMLGGREGCVRLHAGRQDTGLQARRQR